MSPANEPCSSCFFFHQVKVLPNGAKVGECRKSPPTHDTYHNATFPRIHNADTSWCGAWSRA